MCVYQPILPRPLASRPFPFLSPPSPPLPLTLSLFSHFSPSPHSQRKRVRRRKEQAVSLTFPVSLLLRPLASHPFPMAFAPVSCLTSHVVLILAHFSPSPHSQRKRVRIQNNNLSLSSPGISAVSICLLSRLFLSHPLLPYLLTALCITSLGEVGGSHAFSLCSFFLPHPRSPDPRLEP